MECPKCGSHNFRRLEVVHEDGTIRGTVSNMPACWLYLSSYYHTH